MYVLCSMFQALKYLLKLCSHPLLVIGEKVPESLAFILPELLPATSDIISELHKLQHSPKLVALQEILEECGIGVDASSSEGAISVGQHRVLIFAQHKVCCILLVLLMSVRLNTSAFSDMSFTGISCRPFWT